MIYGKTDPEMGTNPVKSRPNPRRAQDEPYTGRPIPLRDLELIEEAKTGHSEAYGELVLKYQDRVHNACWRICGHVDDAQEVTQEAFLTAWERLDTFRAQSGFYTWVFRIAVNLAISRRRKQARQQLASLDQLAEACGTQVSELASSASDERRDDPRLQADDAEAQALVTQALQALDRDHRAVVVLRDIEGMSYQEIGEILDLAPGTVRSRLHRARMAVRAALAARDADADER